MVILPVYRSHLQKRGYIDSSQGHSMPFTVCASRRASACVSKISQEILQWKRKLRLNSGMNNGSKSDKTRKTMKAVKKISDDFQNSFQGKNKELANNALLKRRNRLLWVYGRERRKLNSLSC